MELHQYQRYHSRLRTRDQALPFMLTAHLSNNTRIIDKTGVPITSKRKRGVLFYNTTRMSYHILNITPHDIDVNKNMTLMSYKKQDIHVILITRWNYVQRI